MVVITEVAVKTLPQLGISVNVGYLLGTVVTVICRLPHSNLTPYGRVLLLFKVTKLAGTGVTTGTEAV